jgi:hypothetical protein
MGEIAVRSWLLIERLILIQFQSIGLYCFLDVLGVGIDGDLLVVVDSKA